MKDSDLKAGSLLGLHFNRVRIDRVCRVELLQRGAQLAVEQVCHWLQEISILDTGVKRLQHRHQHLTPEVGHSLAMVHKDAGAAIVGEDAW